MELIGLCDAGNVTATTEGMISVLVEVVISLAQVHWQLQSPFPLV